MRSRRCWLGILTLTSGFGLSLVLAAPLHEAASEGDIGRVKRLIAEDANVNAKEDKRGLTPLHWAAAKGYQAIAERLIAKGANVNATSKDGWTPLRWASDKGHKDIVELLKRHGAKE